MKFANGWNKCIEYIAKFWRYFLAIIVFALIILMTIFVISKNSAADEKSSGVYEDFEMNSNVELNSLIENYYTAYSSGNIAAIQAYASPISNGEASYIQFLSQYIEAFNVVDVYSKRGVDEGSYLVSVYVKEKFVGVNTAAPGLDFFYVRTNSNGMLYIDNTYSNFNQQEQEMKMDPEIVEIIDIYRQRDDTMKLKDMVSKDLESAFKADPNLEKFVKETMPIKIGEWKAQYQAQKAQQDAIAKAKEKEAADAKAKAQADAQAAQIKAQQEAQENANATIVVITTKVNVRDSASEAGNVIGQVDGGTQVTKYGEENGFTKIDFNGQRAFVKSDYVTTVEQAQAVAAQGGGQTITLTGSVNIRSGMSETSDRIAGAIPGDTVTVIQQFAEGWTKVSYKGQEGYIKTEFLK